MPHITITSTKKHNHDFPQKILATKNIFSYFILVADRVHCLHTSVGYFFPPIFSPEFFKECVFFCNVSKIEKLSFDYLYSSRFVSTKGFVKKPSFESNWVNLETVKYMAMILRPPRISSPSKWDTIHSFSSQMTGFVAPASASISHPASRASQAGPSLRPNPGGPHHGGGGPHHGGGDLTTGGGGGRPHPSSQPFGSDTWTHTQSISRTTLSCALQMGGPPMEYGTSTSSCHPRLYFTQFTHILFHTHFIWKCVAQ